MKKLLRLDKPNQLIGIISDQPVTLIQRKCFNVFLQVAQQEVLFGKYEGEKIKEERRYIFEITARDLINKAGISKDDFEYIKNELKSLSKIIFDITDTNNKNNWTIFHILDKVKREEDIFKFYLDSILVQALKNHNYFTELDLLKLSKLNSNYSVILYELAIRYFNENNKFIKIPKMTIEKFRELTNTTYKYEKFPDLRKRVLDTACNEISQKTDIKLSYTTEKQGRRIAYIDFKVERKDVQEELSIPPELIQDNFSDEVKELYELLPDEEQIQGNRKTLTDLVKDYEFKYIKADIEYAKKFNPNRFIGFLVESCKNGHFGKADLEKKNREEEIAKKKREEVKRKEKIKKEIEAKTKEKALVKYEKSSEKDLEEYIKEYNDLPDFVKNKNTMSKESFIIGALGEKIKKELEKEYNL